MLADPAWKIQAKFSISDMARRDIRGMDLGLLRIFDALMRERSVSRTATRLFLSQPAVSAALGRLRDTFGDPLFTRTSHGVEPTAKALALAPRVERVLVELTGLLEGDGFDPAASARIFRIGGSDHACRVFLPALVRTLAAQASGVRVFWHPVAFVSMAEQLRRGDIDIALLPRMSPPEAVEFEALYQDGYCFAARRDHPRFRGGVTLGDFCAVPHVFLGYGTSVLDDLVDERLAALGRARVAQVAVTSFGQMLDLLDASDHVAILPGVVARTHAQRLCVHPLPVEVPGYTLYVCWHRRSGADAGLRWLRDELVRIGGQAGAAVGAQGAMVPAAVRVQDPSAPG